MGDPVIDIKGATRIYHVGDVDVVALDHVDLRVEPGEFVAIMGASGSGKSTLMAILGCLERPSQGAYFFEGVDVASLSEPELARIRSERLGFVFQSFNLLARTSALENVALPLFYARAGAGDAGHRLERARAALDRVGLADRGGNTPAQLSGGQQQRVAIARALINEPALLLADEPTGNLDTKNSHEIMATLTALNREQGVTIVVVTHETDIAAYADRVVTMRDGKIISDESKTSADGKAARDHARGRAAQRLGAAQDASQPAPREASVFAFAQMIIAAAIQAILRNKLRSALTMLGVFVGVAALIAMVAVGQGANERVRKQIESLGTNLLVVVPGATSTSGVRAGFGSASTLTVSDVQAIQRECPAVALVSYLMRQSGQVTVGNQNWTTNVQGVSPNYPPVTNWTIAVGRGISRDDNSNEALVVVLGRTVYLQLFGGTLNPIGASVLVKGVPLRVIGVLAPKGQSTWGQDQDDLVMIPFSTAERKVLGVAAPSQQQTNLLLAIYPPPPNPFNLQLRMTGYVNQIYVQAISPADVQTAITQVTNVLLRRHRIAANQVRRLFPKAAVCSRGLGVSYCHASRNAMQTGSASPEVASGTISFGNCAPGAISV